MSRLGDLPPEIRLRIYELVFQGTLVHPNPIMWARQPACDDKTKFERLQAEWPGPVGLLMSSKFFNTDPLTARSFYMNATFCFGVQWQWPAFTSFVKQRSGDPIDPARLITSIMDTTPLFNTKSHLDLDQITVEILPNLKHVHLNLFSNTSNCAGRVISKIFGYELDDQFDCAGCDPDFRGLHRYERWNGHDWCACHRAPDPARFALTRSDTRVGRNSALPRGIWTCAPSRFILSAFFNEDVPYPGLARHWRTGRRDHPGAELKTRIMDGFVTVHLSWEMVFDRVKYGEDDIRVNAFFDSSDWRLRYNWNGKAYEIEQIKPQVYKPETGRFHEIRKSEVSMGEMTLS